MKRRQQSVSKKLKSIALQDLEGTQGIREDIEKLSEPERLNYAIKILDKQPIHRNQFDILLLQRLTNRISFFKQNCDEKMHLMCCKQMRYQHGTKDQILMEIGQKGSTFYIILEGTVTVLIRFGPTQGLQEVATLTDGQYFGELALMNENALRSATIKLKTDCHFAYLEKDVYQTILMSKQMQDLSDNILIFMQIPYFAAWGERDLVRILYRRDPSIYQYKQVVYHQGDSSATGIFLIKSGLFKVQMEVKHSKSNLGQGEVYQTLTEPMGGRNKHHFQKTIDLLILPTGHSFGEEETYLNIPRLATVICHSQSAELYILSQQELRKRVFWDQQVVKPLKSHIVMRQKHRIHTINSMVRMVDNIDLIEAEQKGQQYLQQQQVETPTTPPKFNPKKIFRLEGAFDFSSKRERFHHNDLVMHRSTQSLTSVPKMLYSSKISVNNTASKQESTNEKKNTEYSKVQPYLNDQQQPPMKYVIDDLIQRMKDRINGRISKKNKFIDDMQFGRYLYIKNRAKVPESPPAQVRSNILKLSPLD